MQTVQKRQNTVRYMVSVALFAALAFASTYTIHIPVSFLTFDIKDLFIAICGMTFGPVSALVVTLISALLEYVTISDTGYWGLLMNILSSGGFAITASLIYKFRRTFAGAVLALVSGVLAMTAAMMAFNLLITPIYMGVDRATVASMLPTFFLPFNLTKGTLNAALVMLLYKPLGKALRRFGLKLSDRSASAPAGAGVQNAGAAGDAAVTAGKRNSTWISYLIAAAVAVACVLILILVLGGKITWGK